MFKLTLPVLVFAGCWSASAPRSAHGVDVEVASVSLADDCPDVAVAEAAGDQPDRPSVQSSSVACAPGYDCHGGSRRSSCEQTTMQLSIKAAASATTIQIKRVELLDRTGKQVGVLTPRRPTRWTDGGEYLPWNEQVASQQQLTASYALSAPNWDDVPGGKDAAAPYRVRVTIAIGDEERTFDKPAMLSVEAPAMPEPPMVT